MNGPNSTTIMLVTQDGEKKAFVPEELQAKLIDCCLASGIRDFWLAEDVSNAVENTLTYQAGKGIIFSEQEINSFLIKMLNDIGYPEVADVFKENNKVVDQLLKVSKSTINNLLKNNLGLIDSNKLKKISQQVLETTKLIGITEAAPPLLIELGRHYKQEKIKIKTLKPIEKQATRKQASWKVSRSEMISMVSDQTKDLIGKKIIDVVGISNMFTSLKIDIRLKRLAEENSLSPIITELFLLPYFNSPANCINELISKVNNSLLENSEFLDNHDKLPIFLRFPDIHSFAKSFMGVNLPEGEKICREIAVSFAENLDFPVFIKGVQFNQRNANK